MRRSRTVPLVVTALLLWGAAFPALAPGANPPTPLAPADGAAVTAGQGVTFQVASDVPADQLLWVRVSRSPAPVDGCGLIGNDVAIVSIDPTSDPDVYAGTPTLFKLYDFWLNRAGTYYWQAYRISCDVAPVRTLVVTGVRPVEIGPQPLEPADGAQLPTGGQAFRAAVAEIDPGQYLWLHVSRSSQRDATGLIGEDTELEALVPTGDPTVWSAIPTYFTHATFWMNTPGTYFWQPYRISGFGDPDGFVEGTVRSFTLTGSATPTPTPTPAPATPVTIRGDEAFVKGTANDLYLACTTLDLYLVDVLPAGRRVAVTGAADLRLRGRIVTIELDGKRVGSAFVRSSGAFSATVKAPARARRAKARYRAVIGSTRSQNLRLVRRMVAAKLSRSGTRMTLTGRITRPFARRPARVGIQRYAACGRLEKQTVKAVRPTSTGRFSVSFRMPDASVRALMYRATTRVASRPGGGATHPTFTLPRALDVG